MNVHSGAELGILFGGLSCSTNIFIKTILTHTHTHTFLLYTHTHTHTHIYIYTYTFLFDKLYTYTHLTEKNLVFSIKIMFDDNLS